MRYALVAGMLMVSGAGLRAATPPPVQGPGDAPTRGADKLDPAAVKPGVWYKRSPLPGAPTNPRMGYEAAWAYDPHHRVILRWGGHNQGGGGEQHSEMWAYDPLENTFALKEPNLRPPGACCNRDQAFDVALRRYVRFPSFSASHGWQWRREVYQMQSSAWAYDYATNRWVNMRPLPEPRVGPLRGAAYDTDHQVTVVAQGQGVGWGTAIYDLYANTWTMMNARNEPPQRNTFGMAYDPVGRKFVTFGSQSGDDPRTWIYDLRRNEWQGLKLTPHPPAERNGAVMAYDSLNRVMLCVVLTWKDGVDPEDKRAGRVPAGLETWAFDPARPAWKKIDVARAPEVSGSRNRLLAFVPELNVFVLENRTGAGLKMPDGTDRHAEQQIWIFRFAEHTPPADPPPAPPTELKAVASSFTPTVLIDTRTGQVLPPPGPTVRLRWTAGPSDDVDSYVVYRGTGERPWQVDYRRIDTVKAGTFGMTDSNVRPGTLYHYYVTARDKAGREGPPSLKVRTQPGVVDDLLVSVLDAKRVELAWSRPEGSPSGYHVYRAPVQVFSTDQFLQTRDKHKLNSPIEQPFLGAVNKVGRFERLTDKPINALSYTDAGVDLERPIKDIDGPVTQDFGLAERQFAADGAPYRWAVFAYRVTAVNDLGIEGGPSPWTLTVPGPIQDLKSRERPGMTDLRWSANREKGIAGYRVYRLEGRFDDAGVTMITPRLVPGTAFIDSIPNGLDDPAKRYYVVAVDALGQEGLVGSPTWGAREYAKYYVPFIGEWHQ